MDKLIKKWLAQAEKSRRAAHKTQNEMTEQGYLAEAHTLEVCADELKRASEQPDTPRMHNFRNCGLTDHPDGAEYCYMCGGKIKGG